MRKTNDAFTAVSTFGAPYVINQVHRLRSVEAVQHHATSLIQCDEKVLPITFRFLKIVANTASDNIWDWTKFLGLTPPENFSPHHNPRGPFIRTSLASYRLHRKVNIDLDFAVDEFTRRHNRRLVQQWISQVEVFLAPLGQWQPNRYRQGCYTILVAIPSYIYPYFFKLLPTK